MVAKSTEASLSESTSKAELFLAIFSLLDLSTLSPLHKHLHHLVTISVLSDPGQKMYMIGYIHIRYYTALVKSHTNTPKNALSVGYMQSPFEKNIEML